MTAPLKMRRDRTPAVLRKRAKAETDARIARRMLAIANVLDDMSRDEAARAAGMDRQTLQDWVIRYNEHGFDGLADQPRRGRPPKLAPHEKAALVEIALAGPDPETSGISAYTRDDLVRICEKPRSRISRVSRVAVSCGKTSSRVATPLRPEQQALLSITTLRRHIAVPLAKRLPRCPCCLRTRDAAHALRL